MSQSTSRDLMMQRSLVKLSGVVNAVIKMVTECLGVTNVAAFELFG